MTTRKPKLNLLYVPATETPWLQLQVVSSDHPKQHAQRWQGMRFSGSAGVELPPPPVRTRH
jgi:hypothetical protein